MRIAIDARELRTSTGRYVERLLHYLQQFDNENDYIVLLKPRDFDGWEPTNPRFQKVPCKYKEFTFGEQLGFARQLYGLKADLVHFAMTHQPILYFNSSITTMHDLTTARFYNPAKHRFIFFVKQQVYKAVIWYAAHKSKRVITPTEFVKHDVIYFTHIKGEKVVVTNLAADEITDRPEPYAPLEGKKFIMYVGRAQPHKNLPRLVEAFDIVRKSHPDLHLVLAGKEDKNFQQLEAWITSKGIKNVVFTGYISDAQLRWAYEHAAAYVFPSVSEGFGLPGLEAMQYGLPLVSSNATCLPEVYQDAALYFDPHDREEMAAKIQQVLGDERLRQKLIEVGKRVVSSYSWKRTAEQTLAVYQEVLNQKQ